MSFVPFYRRPGFKTLVGIGVWVAIYVAALGASDPAPGWDRIALDLVLGALTATLAAALVAQFVLPVRHPADRREAIRRLLTHWTGARGPVMFIEHGRALESHQDKQGFGPGVLFVDAASAAVLRTDVRFTRAVGPGLAFTEPGETLAEALDLRRQIRRLPGTPPGHASPDPGRTSVALTRDGIPIAADLEVSFMLDPGHSGPPREGRHPHLSPFEFHPPAAERAVFGHAYGAQSDLPWTELPLRLALDLWREQVKLRPLQAFFETRDGRTALQEIENAILAHLTRPRSAPVDAAPAVSRELQILDARGVRVLAVGVRNLYLPDDVRRERIQAWYESWSGFLQSEASAVESRLEELRRQAEREAFRQLARELTSGLRARLARGDAPSRRETLSLLLGDAARLADDPEAVADGAVLATRLREMQREVMALEEHGRPLDPDTGP